MLVPKVVRGPLWERSQFKDIKDPCPCFDGTRWHIFGSGGSVRDEVWRIVHAQASSISGPWEESVCTLVGVSGEHVAAPGVVYDPVDGLFHMFVQTDFLAVDGTVEYLTSADAQLFTHQTTALRAQRNTPEAGIYDPHPTIINGKKCLVYSAMAGVEHTATRFIAAPDIYVAQSISNSWAGPWERVACILDHEHIRSHHNQKNDPQYEWGIEGPQLVELPNGNILLNATCFLPEGAFGTRQRVFFAIADSLLGPYNTLGPVIDTSEPWRSGENGHATALVEDDRVLLFFQARSKDNSDVLANDWRYGIAEFNIADIFSAAGQVYTELSPKEIDDGSH